jgi:hypothetical protein
MRRGILINGESAKIGSIWVGIVEINTEPAECFRRLGPTVGKIVLTQLRKVLHALAQVVIVESQTQRIRSIGRRERRFLEALQHCKLVASRRGSRPGEQAAIES